MLLAVWSCGKIEKPQKPNDLIPKDKMTDILYELYIINAAKGVNKKLLEDNGVNPENYVLKKFDIDSLQFANSNNYYAFDTKTYKSIVDDVKAKLELDKTTFEDIQKTEGLAAKRRRDSIKNAKILRIKEKTNDSMTLKKSPKPNI